MNFYLHYNDSQKKQFIKNLYKKTDIELLNLLVNCFYVQNRRETNFQHDYFTEFYFEIEKEILKRMFQNKNKLGLKKDLKAKKMLHCRTAFFLKMKKLLKDAEHKLKKEIKKNKSNETIFRNKKNACI